MKAKTKRLRQLHRMSGWLEKARPDLQARALGGDYGSFCLLISVEQLVKYLKMLEEKEE